jgi:hypothetical protein
VSVSVRVSVVCCDAVDGTRSCTAHRKPKHFDDRNMTSKNVTHGTVHGTTWCQLALQRPVITGCGPNAGSGAINCIATYDTHPHTHTHPHPLSVILTLTLMYHRSLGSAPCTPHVQMQMHLIFTRVKCFVYN